MHKKAALILLVFAVVVSFAFAAKEAQDGAQDNVNKTAENAKNMTFGQCVSDAADVKNTCYATIKTARETCMQAAQNATDKDASKSCATTYKKDQTQCKADFKAAKKECGKIKHSAWEGFKAKFK